MRRLAWSWLVLAAAGCPSPADNQPPTARLRLPVIADARQPVRVDARASTDEDGILTRYAYVFGDGTPESERPHPEMDHVFVGPGRFEVLVTVTDDDGASATVRRGITLVDVLQTPYCTGDGGCDGPDEQCDVDAGVCVTGP